MIRSATGSPQPPGQHRVPVQQRHGGQVQRRGLERRRRCRPGSPRRRRPTAAARPGPCRRGRPARRCRWRRTPAAPGPRCTAAGAAVEELQVAAERVVERPGRPAGCRAPGTARRSGPGSGPTTAPAARSGHPPACRRSASSRASPSRALAIAGPSVAGVARVGVGGQEHCPAPGRSRPASSRAAATAGPGGSASGTRSGRPGGRRRTAGWWSRSRTPPVGSASTEHAGRGRWRRSRPSSAAGPPTGASSRLEVGPLGGGERGVARCALVAQHVGEGQPELGQGRDRGELAG